MDSIITVLEFIAAIAAGVATAVPLIVKVINYANELRRSKNWGKLLGLVLELMEEAEELVVSGADKKAWVMGGVERLAQHIDYNLDMEEVSELIDELCAMSKKVNTGGENYER